MCRPNLLFSAPLERLVRFQCGQVTSRVRTINCQVCSRIYGHNISSFLIKPYLYARGMWKRFAALRFTMESTRFTIGSSSSQCNFDTHFKAKNLHNTHGQLTPIHPVAPVRFIHVPKTFKTISFHAQCLVY